MHVTELGRNPRIIQLKSTVDGNIYDFKDDGASIIGSDANPYRQQLRDNLLKMNPRVKNIPVYVIPNGASFDRVSGDFDDRDKGDPLLRARKESDPEIQEGMKKSLGIREARNLESELAVKPELARLKKKAVENVA